MLLFLSTAPRVLCPDDEWRSTRRAAVTVMLTLQPNIDEAKQTYKAVHAWLLELFKIELMMKKQYSCVDAPGNVRLRH